MENKASAKEITTMAAMAAMVFVMTFFFKIPSPNGYVHLGDSMIIIAVLLLGTKKGIIAGSVGAAAADALGGYAQWILPTFGIKAVMALCIGLFAYNIMKKYRFGWLVGAAIGGAVQVAAYAAVKIPMYDMAYAMISMPGDIIQTIFGIVAAFVIIPALSRKGLLKATYKNYE